MLFLLLSYIPSIACGVHAVRTGQNMYWLWILVVGGPLGAAIYFFAVMAPDLAGGRTARTAAKAVKQTINPEADYKKALKAVDETPTAAARMKAADAAEKLGRWQEAETQWAAAATGLWADDPVILFRHAQCLLELGRPGEALGRLEQMKKAGGSAETPQAALAFARAYEGLGRADEADAPYRFAADRAPGLEAGARYVAFMARTGRHSDAEIGLAELDRRLKKVAAPLRAEARVWRDLAAKAVADTKSGANS